MNTSSQPTGPGRVGAGVVLALALLGAAATAAPPASAGGAADTGKRNL
jgi:hypothetical protein